MQKKTPTQQQLKNAIRPIVESILREASTTAFTKPELATAERAGSALADAVKWDGGLVGLAFLEALTQCNFHSERRKIAPILSKIMETEYPTEG